MIIERRNWTILITDTRFGHKSLVHCYETTLDSVKRTADLVRKDYITVSIVAGLK